MIHIILITTYNRPQFLNRCIESIFKTTPESPIFIVSDGSDYTTRETLFDYLDEGEIEAIIASKRNIGITPSIESGLYYINNWFRFQRNECKFNDEKVWISYIQDDVEFLVKDWPNILYNCFLEINNSKNEKIGFITGHEAPEHKNSTISKYKSSTGYLMEIRKHIRATHMMAPLEYWMKQLPISVNGERNIPRGHPGGKGLEQLGSDVDWWFIRGHKNSVEKLNYNNLVIPGITKHIGAKNSTWQPNELPETTK